MSLKNFNMKTRKLHLAAITVLVLAILQIGAKEEIKIEKTVIVQGDEEALEAARKYMREGARWIHIGPKFEIFSERKAHEWEVQGTFYINQ